jgi:BASS family bile acid:Na+ symporter
MIALLNATALATMMLSMGLQVKFEEVLASAGRTRLLSLALIANYMLVPAATIGLLFVFQANPLVSAGFLILAVCPGAPLGPPITAVAKGDVAWAVGIMLILSGLSALLSPALLAMLLARIAPATELSINYRSIVQTLLFIQILPLAVGLCTHYAAPRLTRRIAKPVGLLSNVLLLALIGLIVAAQYETLSEIRLRGWMGMSLLLLASLGIGWVCGGPGLATRKAMAITTVVRNAAVGLVIATNNFAGTLVVTAVVAYSLISTIGALGVAVLLGKGTEAATHSLPAG